MYVRFLVYVPPTIPPAAIAENAEVGKYRKERLLVSISPAFQCQQKAAETTENRQTQTSLSSMNANLGIISASIQRRVD